MIREIILNEDIAKEYLDKRANLNTKEENKS